MTFEVTKESVGVTTGSSSLRWCLGDLGTSTERVTISVRRRSVLFTCERASLRGPSVGDAFKSDLRGIIDVLRDHISSNERDEKSAESGKHTILRWVSMLHHTYESRDT